MTTSDNPFDRLPPDVLARLAKAAKKAQRTMPKYEEFLAEAQRIKSATQGPEEDVVLE